RRAHLVAAGGPVADLPGAVVTPAVGLPGGGERTALGVAGADAGDVGGRQAGRGVHGRRAGLEAGGGAVAELAEAVGAPAVRPPARGDPAGVVLAGADLRPGPGRGRGRGAWRPGRVAGGVARLDLELVGGAVGQARDRVT